MNKLITNSSTTNFYNTITKLLKQSKSFYFNVAFINFSGIQLLFDSFEDAKKRGVKGKILTSTYLNFTQVKALKAIQNFENISLKIYDCDENKKGFHSKAYIFEMDDCYKILLGSSNITASAFKTNIEWNIKTIVKNDDIFLKNILSEYHLLWEEASFIDDDFINAYDSFCKKIEVNKFFYKKAIQKNSMQKIALENLKNLRNKNQKKALVIAATGTGKSYLAAFDVKEFDAKRVLFIVHRENILIKAKQSFETIITNKKMGLFTGNNKELDCEYIFATIQTLSNKYNSFSKDEFDYIIVDEAHHITSPSYKVVYNYFKPKFLLGLTATPNRSDNQSIYEIFDENIACNIKLHEALENELIAPFHYYGISDINSIDYENCDLTKVDLLAKLLMVNRRVDYIIEKMNFYGFSGNKRKALGFCVSKEHAFYMCEEFCKRGIDSKVLTSDDSIEKRESVIKELEDENSKIEIIFSVDIFNEGLDIPSINIVLMLRPTNSSIVFIQQLGRGLRKYQNKEFLTILDFIGNHKKAYLIALALLTEKRVDKESIKLSLLNSFANIKNAFICMDEISRARILEQIDTENFTSIKYLKEQYFEFKTFLKNKIPKLQDYIIYDEFISPINFINESKSYIEFLLKVEKDEKLSSSYLDENFIKASRFIESLLPIKRVYEFVLLKYLLKNSYISFDMASNILDKYLDKVSKESLIHSFNFLNQEYLDKGQVERYLRLVEIKNNKLYRSEEFSKLLKNQKYIDYFEDVLAYGVISYENEFGTKDYNSPFLKLYEKYNMLNIAQLCNFPKIHSSFRGSGFLKYKDDFFLFITIDKNNYKQASKYKNSFLSEEVFTYISKPSMSCEKGDGERLINNQKYNIKLHIFVRKFSHIDKKVQAFIYLGLADVLSYKNNKPIDLELKLKKPLEANLYEEFTKIVLTKNRKVS